MATHGIKDKAVRYFNEVVGKGDLEPIDELVHSEAKDLSGIWSDGKEGFREHISWFHSAFDVSSLDIERVITDGEHAVVYWRVKGRHVGPAFGVEPSGKEIENTAISTLRFQDGRIIEYEVSFDLMNFFVQVGDLGSLARHFANLHVKRNRG
ncbi:MAG: ester cyclase [Trueperaceae bacterium]